MSARIEGIRTITEFAVVVVDKTAMFDPAFEKLIGAAQEAAISNCLNSECRLQAFSSLRDTDEGIQKKVIFSCGYCADSARVIETGRKFVELYNQLQPVVEPQEVQT